MHDSKNPFNTHTYTILQQKFFPPPIQKTIIPQFCSKSVFRTEKRYYRVTILVKLNFVFYLSAAVIQYYDCIN